MACIAHAAHSKKFAIVEHSNKARARAIYISLHFECPDTLAPSMDDRRRVLLVGDAEGNLTKLYQQAETALLMALLVAAFAVASCVTEGQRLLT